MDKQSPSSKQTEVSSDTPTSDTDDFSKEQVDIEQVNGIIQRLMLACDAKNEHQLCKKLSLSRSAVNGWRKRVNVPYVACFRCSDRTGFNVRWLVRGQGPRMTETLDPQSVHLSLEAIEKQIVNALIECEKLGLVEYGISANDEARKLLMNRVLGNIATQNSKERELREQS